MPSYLVDTTVLIDHQRNRKEATKFLLREGLRISYVSVMEMIVGARDGLMLTKNRRLTEGFVIDWGSEEISKVAIELLQNYRIRMGMGMYDALLAATAVVRNLVLVTDNVRHFRGVAGLTVKTLMQVIK